MFQWSLKAFLHLSLDCLKNGDNTISSFTVCINMNYLSHSCDKLCDRIGVKKQLKGGWSVSVYIYRGCGPSQCGSPGNRSMRQAGPTCDGWKMKSDEG